MRTAIMIFVAALVNTPLLAQEKMLAGMASEVSLIGSDASMRWQNAKANEEGLRRIKNDAELQLMVRRGELVPISQNGCLSVDSRLDIRLRYVLPRVASFLNELSQMICPEFRSPFKVNSAVRDIPHQFWLIRKERNLNAASVFGEKASVHLTGAAVDIAIFGLPKAALDCTEQVLLEFERERLIEATKETVAQTVLHMMVFREYEERRSVLNVQCNNLRP